MDRYQANKITSDFLAVYKPLFRYCNGSWWAWDVDHYHWDWMDAKGRMGDALMTVTRDLFPDNVKIQNQVARPYIQEQLIRAMRPHLMNVVLSQNPFSQ